MNGIIKHKTNSPVNLDENFIRELVQGHLGNEPKRENHFLSDIFSRRVTNTFIRFKLYENCTFHISGREEDD